MLTVIICTELGESVLNSVEEVRVRKIFLEETTERLETRVTWGFIEVL